MRPDEGEPETQEAFVGAAVEIHTGDIDPVHLKGRHVMLGDRELGVLDGTASVVRYEIPAGRHLLTLKDGLSTCEPVGFHVQSGHCAQLTLRDARAGMFSVVFGGWFALKRSGDVVEGDEHEGRGNEPGAREIPVEEVPADA